MDCCRGSASDEFFDDRFARRELRRYRRRGPAPWTRKLLSAIEGASVPADSTLLDVGGGVGAIHHELLEHGFARATQIDASSAFRRRGREVERLHHDGRVDLKRGDFHTLAVALHRPTSSPSTASSAAIPTSNPCSATPPHALRLVAFTYPAPAGSSGCSSAQETRSADSRPVVPGPRPSRRDGRRPRAERHAPALGRGHSSGPRKCSSVERVPLLPHRRHPSPRRRVEPLRPPHFPGAAADRLRLQAGDPRARPVVLELHGRLRRQGAVAC
jgi:hypothetical protein